MQNLSTQGAFLVAMLCLFDLGSNIMRDQAPDPEVLKIDFGLIINVTFSTKFTGHHKFKFCGLFRPQPNMASKYEAVAVGINYAGTSNALSGCINDAMNWGKFWTKMGVPCDVITDDVNPDKTTVQGLIQILDDGARRSYIHNLEFMWFSFSCHGMQVRDRNGDEKDHKDEAMVGSDMLPVTDDIIQVAMSHFNPKTLVVFHFDCCHSKTLGDFLFSWTRPYKKPVVENIHCQIKAKIISISGCIDSGTSADAYNIHGDKKYSGASSTFLMDLIPQHKTNIFELVDALEKALTQAGFKQKPKICSTYNLALQPAYLPAKLTAEKKKRPTKPKSEKKKTEKKSVLNEEDEQEESKAPTKKRKAAPKKPAASSTTQKKRKAAAPPKHAADEDENVENGLDLEEETVEIEDEGQLDLEDDE